jgi:hypothetical protein
VAAAVADGVKRSDSIARSSRRRKELVMSMRSLLPLLILVAGAVQAQSVPSAPPAASDSWSRPAAPASAAQAYGDDHAHPLRTDEGSSSGSHFKFKDRKSYEPARNAALEASGKAGVGMGTQMDRNGRPAVNCAQTPMDPSCR